MTDALERLISSKQEERNALRRQLAEIEKELETLIHAAKLLSRLVPPPVGNVESPGIPKLKGRQPGAISKEWRKILSRVDLNYPQGASPEIIASFGKAAGLANLRPTDAKQRAEKYVTIGYFERIGDCYKVTDAARQRFKFEESGRLPLPDPPTLTSSEESGLSQ